MAIPPMWLLLPFVLLLGAMAIGPILAPRWWLRHFLQVSLGLGAISAACSGLYSHDWASLELVGREYFSFIALVGSLYVVAGGIELQVPQDATPLANVVFLFIGAVAANVLGTTGAAMLLIRPWLQFNRNRWAAHHLAFFIFLVANVGGSLTPIGDPPLLLGYLQGIPFWWVAEKCWPMWTVGTGLLLGLFFLVDYRAARAAGRTTAPRRRSQGWRLAGLPNLFFLAVILGAVLSPLPFGLREGLMVAAAAGAYGSTRKSIHQANEFSFHPVKEVAVLFAGIFVTMAPALAWLHSGAARWLGAHPAAGTLYWGAGACSAVLDNAPTYLGFLSALPGPGGAGNVGALLEHQPLQILAVSVGSVFFGAATYIGNGPNFMIKTLAEQRGIPGPSFLNFVLKFSLPYLLPVLVAVWWIFFRD